MDKSMTTILIVLMNFLLYSHGNDFKLRNGDLIFQESRSGGVSEAIKGVTGGIEGYHFTHVGMVYIDPHNTVYVIEATPPRVKITPLQEFLYPDVERKAPPHSVVGRLKARYRCCIPKAIKKGLSLVGKAYDEVYDLNNDSYYCSELIYFMLLGANHGKPVFQLNKMTFKAAETDSILPMWQTYFEKRGVAVPEGEPGINPGAMSRSEVIYIVHHY